MSSQKNSQRRLLSSTRVQLARDLHDSIAQDLVAIGYKLDLLIADLPSEFRARTRTIRAEVTAAIAKVRKELFALRDREFDPESKLQDVATPLSLSIKGKLNHLDPNFQRIIKELVGNAAKHSKGRNIQVEIEDSKISVSDDGLGMLGLGELVAECRATMNVISNQNGTKVEITLP